MRPFIVMVAAAVASRLSMAVALPEISVDCKQQPLLARQAQDIDRLSTALAKQTELIDTIAADSEAKDKEIARLKRLLAGVSTATGHDSVSQVSLSNLSWIR